ncbi:hypothetical protein AB834_05375 [PVC group bacterium (ex Bugula neritina AB1)]|nr:hypothetical protein AB834_05375 [PVC group bacterium (ex Bugula neritina AB1)]
MKILSFFLVHTFLIASIAQADLRDVPDKMPVSHFQNRKFRKPTIEPKSNLRPEDVPKSRVRRGLVSDGFKLGVGAWAAGKTCETVWNSAKKTYRKFRDRWR